MGTQLNHLLSSAFQMVLLLMNVLDGHIRYLATKSSQNTQFPKCLISYFL